MIMEKTKLLTFAVIALLILNLGTLGFLFATGPKGEHHPPHGRPEPKEIIIERLHFNEKQQAEYEELIKEHRKHIREVEDKIRASKDELYQLLKEKVYDGVKKDRLFTSLATYQREIEITHFNHFEDIKRICTQEQLSDFNELTEELSGLFSKGHRQPHD
jgi:periplasmic protein CpxP/Spy